jgi:hypothetical protein
MSNKSTPTVASMGIEIAEAVQRPTMKFVATNTDSRAD